MFSQWEESEASKFDGEIGDLIYALRLIGQDESLGLFQGANISKKQTVKNLLGEEVEALFIDNGQQSPPFIEQKGFTTLYTSNLAGLRRLEFLPVDLLTNAIACSRTWAEAPVPPMDVLTHAMLPLRCILRAQPDSVLAVASTPKGLQRLHSLYDDSVLTTSYVPSGLKLAKACFEAYESQNVNQLMGMYIQGHGLLTFGETILTAYTRMVDLADKAVKYLERQASWNIPVTLSPREDQSIRQDLAALRKAVSEVAGTPLILSMDDELTSTSFSQRDDFILTRIGPTVAEHVMMVKRRPMIGRDVESFASSYQQDFNLPGKNSLPASLDFAPRILLDPELGLCSLGKTASEAQQAKQIYRHLIKIMQSATILDEFNALSTRDLVDAEIRAHSLSKACGEDDNTPFTGEVALVTGGASGIGKACVESLLERGAAVVTLDINPKVKALFDRPDYLGLECDLTDETAILNCFETFTRAFGGLDMLVLNAGVFPAGCRIESLTLQEWQRVMRINLDSNLVVMREAYPLLKQSPRGGRMVVNASKNVLAPGAGAAAYSASKAAVTQLARVAALEWGKDGIRVNMVHPDAIFDTGIWTEEVLEARAAHYGLTVQQYKTRNVLGVELNSRFVSELVAEMLGPRFEKITGAQIPVDGGSDRVI
jgi:rhamnose utilization protein RhaD (predicted bifunctional aldolase and dehydrogenase)/NAD(P)-dependent dehydrogenase (short-subunit alcohol dehydrogenase family)